MEITFMLNAKSSTNMTTAERYNIIYYKTRCDITCFVFVVDSHSNFVRSVY